MKAYLKYIIIISFVLFSFYYADLVLDISKYNNTILTSINDYASSHDYKCVEGSINNEGIILGASGLIVNKNKSYSTMKGIGFDENLIEYDIDKCILNKENNLDKYILSGNNINSNISLVIDIDSGKYYKKMIDILWDNNIEPNLLVNYKFDDIENKYILLKFNNTKEIKEFNKKNIEYYCVKTNNYDVLKDCIKYKKNSIKINNYIDSNEYIYIKKNLNKGKIFFIKENYINLNELQITINYIRSRGYNIVNINDLLL